MNPVAMDQCPRFDRCIAPICPLDPNWSRSTHLQGEHVCMYLLEAVKTGGEARVRSVLPTQVAEQVPRSTPGIRGAYVHIRRALERASASGSRLEAGARLAARYRKSPGSSAAVPKSALSRPNAPDPLPTQGVDATLCTAPTARHPAPVREVTP